MASYALVVACAALTRLPRMSDVLDSARAFPLAARFIDDAVFRSAVLAQVGLAVDVLWAVASLWLGLWGGRSHWGVTTCAWP